MASSTLIDFLSVFFLSFWSSDQRAGPSFKSLRFKYSFRVEMWSRSLLHLLPFANSAITIKLSVPCRWEDESARERIGHPSSYSEAKKVKSRPFHAHGCLGSSWRGCTSADQVYDAYVQCSSYQQTLASNWIWSLFVFFRKQAYQSIINPEWNFDKMGIGGLDKEFSAIFRRAFASRVFPPELIESLG